MSVLTKVEKSLPATWYYDPEHYERELAAIWYQNWLCVGREDALARPGDFFVAGVGSQSIIVTRDTDGELRAFHNTCRHRGSLLCAASAGRFHNDRIVCPYHTWTYSTKGRLVATPGRIDTDDFDFANYSLYEVHVDSWRGFIHINLADEPEVELHSQLGEEAALVANWPLESLRIVHREKQTVACNWKIFWENYCECYHCPRVHPELCRVMPVYKKAVFDESNLPGWQPAYDGDTGDSHVGEGMRTWALDGQSSLPTIDGLSEDDVAMGVEFASFTASMYLVAHPDYVRTVRIVPTGPESIDLVVDWLLPDTVEIASAKELEPILGLPMKVIQQDSEVCELNQRGLRSHKHKEGVLVAQEYALLDFHEWVRERLATYTNSIR